jgi:AraC-like DNA-binding protein
MVTVSMAMMCHPCQICDMDRILDVVTGGGLAALPRTLRLAWERATPPYRQEPARRAQRHVIIQLTLAGEGRLWPAGGGDGDGLAIPPGVALLAITRDAPLAYGLGRAPRWEFAYANLAGSAAEAVAAELIAGRGHLLPLAPGHPAVQGLLHRLPVAGSATATLDAGASARIAWELLSALAEGPAEGPGHDLAARAMAWLRDRLGEDVGVADAAAALGVSREHLTRVFAAGVGQTPAAWQRQQRLDLAEALLRDRDRTVAEAARRCGFASASHFIAAFRSRHGTTPRRWRG